MTKRPSASTTSAEIKIVDCQAEAAGEVADSAAEGQSANPGGGHEA